MKKMVLVIMLVMAMALPAMADKEVETNVDVLAIGAASASTDVIIGIQSGNSSSGATAAVTGVYNISQDKDTQNNNNDQKVEVKVPQKLLELPAQYVPELSFGNGKMQDVTNKLPKFAMGQIKPMMAGDVIVDVILVKSKVSFQNLYKKVISMSKDSDVIAAPPNKVRYQIIMREGQRTWTTGGSFGGGGSGITSSGVGAAGGANIVPQLGGTYAHDLFDIVFIRIMN